jgi:hypothetical protein
MFNDRSRNMELMLFVCCSGSLSLYYKNLVELDLHSNALTSLPKALEVLEQFRRQTSMRISFERVLLIV